jgi:hypothetical protein
MAGTGFCQLTLQATEAFSAAQIGGVDGLLFAAAGSLVAAAETMDLGSAEERAFLATYPAELLERARRAISHALEQSPRIPVIFFFALGQGYEVAIGAALLPAAGTHLIFTGPAH